MPKYTPIKLTQLSANESAAVDVINQNLDSIKENIDDSISRSAKTPSQLVADLDLNGHKILNIGKPVADTDVVRLQDVVENKAEIKQMYDQVMATGERILSAAEVTDEKVQEAADYAAASQNWATKTDGPVSGSDYSSKYYAEQIAEIKDDISTVSGIASDVSAVADNEENINAVNANKTNIDAVADNSSNINTVASNVSDIGTCADNMSAITDAPTQASNAAGSASAAAASATAAAISAAGTHFKLFQHQWFDYELDDMAWLRADTFSWQDGTVYSNAYNHLVDDIDEKTATTETIGSYTISYYLADDGHKITTDETTVANIYNESGVAWYYILDLVNHKFKLPRTEYGFTGIRDSVGNYVPESLPNIKGKFYARGLGGGYDVLGWESGCIQRDSSDFRNEANVIGNGNIEPAVSYKINASLSSSAYQDNAPVQQRSTQMYLYFYVGNYTQSATEQTAGLNSELFNGKLDLNAANLSTQGKSLISGLCMSSDRYDDLILGVSGSSYIAPANGCFFLRKSMYSGFEFIEFVNETTGEVNTNTNYGGAADYGTSFKCAKGDSVQINYNASGATIAFRFIYAKGEENV